MEVVIRTWGKFSLAAGAAGAAGAGAAAGAGVAEGVVVAGFDSTGLAAGAVEDVVLEGGVVDGVLFEQPPANMIPVKRRPAISGAAMKALGVRAGDIDGRFCMGIGYASQCAEFFETVKWRVGAVLYCGPQVDPFFGP